VQGLEPLRGLVPEQKSRLELASAREWELAPGMDLKSEKWSEQGLEHRSDSESSQEPERELLGMWLEQSPAQSRWGKPRRHLLHRTRLTTSKGATLEAFCFPCCPIA